MFFILCLVTCIVHGQNFLDNSFGISGEVRVRVVPYLSPPSINIVKEVEVAREMFIHPSTQNIYACGNSLQEFTGSAANRMICVSLQPSGALNPSFGTNGVISFTVTGFAYAQLESVALDTFSPSASTFAAAGWVQAGGFPIKFPAVCRLSTSNSVNGTSPVSICMALTGVFFPPNSMARRIRIALQGTHYVVGTLQPSAVPKVIQLILVSSSDFSPVRIVSNITGVSPSSGPGDTFDVQILNSRTVLLAWFERNDTTGMAPTISPKLSFVVDVGVPQAPTHTLTLPLPPGVTQCSTQAVTVDHQRNLAWVLGVANLNDNSFRPVVWKIDVASQSVDTSFGVGGMVVLPVARPGSNYTAFAIEYSTFRLQILAQVQASPTDRDIVVYRIYSDDGLRDASWNEVGERIRAGNLTDVILHGSIDLQYRFTGCGLQQVALGRDVNGTLANYRADESYFLRYPAQIGPCTLGGQQCNCTQQFSNCTYDSTTVFVVASAVTPPAVILGLLRVIPNVTIQSSGPLTTKDVFITAQSIRFERNGGIIAFQPSEPGKYVIAVSQTPIVGRAQQVIVLNSTSTTTSACGTFEAQTVEYTATTITVTVQTTCVTSSGLSAGAIAGIVVGSVVGGAAVAVLIVVIGQKIAASSDASAAAAIKAAEMDSLKGQPQII